METIHVVAKKIPAKLHSYRVRLRGLPKSIGADFIFEKVIACFKLHQRNLYDAPEFVLCDVCRFGSSNLDLLVKTTCKSLGATSAEPTLLWYRSTEEGCWPCRCVP